MELWFEDGLHRSSLSCELYHVGQSCHSCKHHACLSCCILSLSLSLSLSPERQPACDAANHTPNPLADHQVACRATSNRLYFGSTIGAKTNQRGYLCGLNRFGRRDKPIAICYKCWPGDRIRFWTGGVIHGPVPMKRVLEQLLLLLLLLLLNTAQVRRNSSKLRMLNISAAGINTCSCLWEWLA